MVHGVCPVVVDDKLWFFYRYEKPEHIVTTYSFYPKGTMLHAEFPKAMVDLSDHYPLQVELEPTRLAILVNERGVGDMCFHEGEWAGTRGRAIPIDGFQLTLRDADCGISYQAHLQDTGDTAWVRDGEYVGTRGASRAVEGFTIRLIGPEASKYELTYRAHIQNQGDTPEVNQGEFCGTKNQRRAVEAIYIKLRRK
jgi:hypothetical protein